MIVVPIDTPENLEALQMPTIHPLQASSRYIGSDENASAQKEADTEMEAALEALHRKAGTDRP